MFTYTPSEKQNKLIELYKSMANEGYKTTDDVYIPNAFNDMEIRAFKNQVRPLFQRYEIKTLLDYGAGGSDYNAISFSGSSTAKEFFELQDVFIYEPARNIDERQIVDAVVCFDVLEHVFISDVSNVIQELFSYANRLLIVNVACYKARALLPNGENAHITIRSPDWWKGQFDAIAVQYPDVAIQLYCSTEWRKVTAYQCYSAGDWLAQENFTTS